MDHDFAGYLRGYTILNDLRLMSYHLGLNLVGLILYASIAFYAMYVLCRAASMWTVEIVITHSAATGNRVY
ncbi:hypothetical protein BVRB_7g179350 [Beta vulgaris subsp. vulgaris]|uniref:Uncharacterized protein n=1 Tax=Beta vulgaris subsp. vulgaris TaxID=3555 RepID=A0A0J8B7R9_BETVV|nr:hypothetical protein BVRB_7g179350 [Beta vulgaris subsp. vulgaris]